MTVPRWAPQNQQSSSAGRDANSVGRDQNIVTTYNQIRASGITISYEDLKAAIDLELNREREQFEDKLAQVEHYSRQQLSEAFEDFTTVQAERDRLLSERATMRTPGFVLRSSWAFLAIAIGVASLLGGYLGYSLASSTSLDEPSRSASTALPSSSQTSSPSAPTSPTRAPTTLSPTYVSRDCSDGEYVVQLASIGDDDPQIRDLRAKILGDDLKYRMRMSEQPHKVKISLGSNYYCDVPDVERLENAFPWIGPFDSRAQASTVCRQLIKVGVSADCFPRK